MNLIKLKEQLLKMGASIGLQVEEETAESLTMHAQITAKEFFIDSIYFRLVTYSSGTLHMFLTFNEIERTYDNLYLLNAFNENSPWFKAYIVNVNGKDFLELHYTAIALDNEKQVTDSFGFLLNELLKDNTLNYLKPLLDAQ